MAAMVLASQATRESARRASMSSGGRRRRGPGPLVAVLLLVVAVGGGWWLVRVMQQEDQPAGPSGAPAVAPAPDSSAQKRTAPPSAPAETPAPANPPAPPAPPAPAATNDANRAANGATPAAAADAARAAEAAPPAEEDGSGVTALAGAVELMRTDPLRARVQLTRLLEGTTLSPETRRRAYDAVNAVNKVLFFQSGVTQGDPMFALYKVEEGDTLPGIGRKLKLDCDYRLIQRINGIRDPRTLRVGQTIKVPKGPFHAEIRKNEFRINLAHGEGAERVLVASFPVGLGEFNSTPTGMFRVRPKSKVVDPPWRNPRTGEYFEANDPKNPIGDRWIGLEGIEPHNRDFAGYGIHGTVEPESIGHMQSMGCVRMLPQDVEVVYELLTEPNSVVVIAP